MREATADRWAVRIVAFLTPIIAAVESYPFWVLNGVLRRLGFTTTPLWFNGRLVWLRDERGSCTVGVVYREVVRGFYEPLTPLEPGGVVLDVGAHVGGFTIPLALANPKVRFVCFEPDPINHFNLRLNVKRAGVTNVTVHRCGLGDGRGLIVEHDDGNTGSSVAAYHVRGKVPSQSLAGMVDLAGGRVALLKLDCEGAEHGAIRSFSDLVGVDAVIAELHETKTNPSVEAVHAVIKSKPNRVTIHKGAKT